MDAPVTPSLPGWFVVIPVKGGPGAKSRLGGTGRAALAEAMARDTADVAARAVGAPERVVVVSSDPGTRDWVCRAGLVHVPDSGEGIDAAAVAGAAVAFRAGAGRVAVLLGDHPAMHVEELVAALKAATDLDHALVADRTGSGSALVTTSRAGDLRCAFGANSARRHEALGLTPLAQPWPGLRLDVDDEADLARALELGVGPRTRAAALGYSRQHAGHDPHRQP